VNIHVFKMSNKGLIKIDESVFDRICPFIQSEPNSTEAGGVLLGRFIKDSKDIVIDKVTIPMVGDKRTRFSFKRSEVMHQRIVDREWNKSKGTCNYLGEWHTHPENYPYPSSVDREDWKRKLKQGNYSSRYLYFIIVGIKEISLWEGDRRTFEFKKLKK
jgi:integrative and conjugative element protein (TIGR02256 family)